MIYTLAMTLILRRKHAKSAAIKATGRPPSEGSSFRYPFITPSLLQTE